MTDVPKKPGLSTGAKWGIGIGAGCLVLVIGMVALAAVGFWFMKGRIEETTTQLHALGFSKDVRGQMLEVKDTISEPTLYLGQVVKIFGNCTTNLAIVAQVAEIHGRVEGKVYFRGQVLTIQPKAELLNGLDVTAQVVQKYGKINGPITGAYQMVDGAGKKP